MGYFSESKGGDKGSQFELALQSAASHARMDVTLMVAASVLHRICKAERKLVASARALHEAWKQVFIVLWNTLSCAENASRLSQRRPSCQAWRCALFNGALQTYHEL